MTKIKNSLVLIAALMSGMLASCGDRVEVDLNKNNRDEKLVANVDEAIPNNTLGTIYDAVISAGDTNSEKVLNNILLLISESKFGNFYDIKKAVEEGKQEDFAKAHDGYEKASDVDDTYHYFLTQINKSFMGYTTNTSYAKENQFFEEKFYDAQRSNLHVLLSVDANSFKGMERQSDGTYLSVGVQTGVSFEYNEANGYGTKEVQKYYQDNYLDVYEGYIRDELLPNLMRTHLVEKYIVDKNYIALGRSSARKIQYVALEDNKSYAEATKKLVTAYASLVLAGKTVNSIGVTATELSAIAAHYSSSAGAYDMNFVADLYKGYLGEFKDDAANGANLLSAAKKIYKAAGFTAIGEDGKDLASVDDSSFVTCRETTYGGYLVSYGKIDVNDRFNNDTDAYNDFTGNDAHRPEVGMQTKLQALKTVDKTTEGWYTDSTLSSLPSSFKERLFKLTIANDVEEGHQSDADEIKNYGWYVNNHYYLARSSYQNVDPNADGSDYDPSPYLLYDDSSSTWYIVRVDAAVKNSKVRSGGDWETSNPDLLKEAIREITHILSDNSSYTKNARQYYVEQAALAYHDQDVYNYFKKTFPDLFD